MSSDVQSYRDLKVWQSAMRIATQAYVLTKSFPRDETYGMTSQIRRAAASIPANIAEGYGRDGTATFVQYLRIANGSLKELETHVMLTSRVGLTDEDQVREILSDSDELGKMLRSLIRSIQSPSG
ncbi:MAG: four helix bundle protein [Hyphomonadaceae bacterium]|nr:four helix bundle protein [Hyphomonadaceae bacterium]